jgi:hypothetical protein
MPGEQVPGDAWTFRRLPTGGVLMVADGLGHGPDAAIAAREAVRVMRESQASAPCLLAEFVHRALATTRGAAIGIADIAVETAQVAFVGIGNISASVVTGGVSRPPDLSSSMRASLRALYIATSGAGGTTQRWRSPGCFHEVCYRHPAADL